LAAALRRCVAELGAQVVLVSQCCGPAAPQDDRIAARRVLAASGLSPADALILDAELDAGQLKSVYRQLDLLVATRLHAAIFALGAGVPTALISYLPKGRGVMELLGLEAWCLDIGAAGGPALWALIERAWSGRAALRDAIGLSRRVLALAALEADLPPAPRPKIMQFVTGAAIGGELGGAEQYGIQLARQLAGRGFEVLVCGFWRFDSPSERRWVELLRGEGIAVRLLVAPTGGALRAVSLAALRYVRLLRAERPLLVNSHFERGDLLGLLASFALRRPPLLVRTMHAPEQWQRRPWLGALLNLWWLPRRFAAEIAISGDTRQALDRRPAARLLGKTSTVIHNGIEAAWFDPPPPGPPPAGLPAGRPLVAAIGRLDERKGYRYLIAAAAAVRRVFPGAAFAIIGEGELRPELERQIAALGLGGSVRLLGSRLDVPALLPHIDVVVSAGLWEGMPTALIEAMAREVPVIATTVSHELIRHGATGALVPPGDALALAQALIALLANPAGRRRMAEAARRRA
ncbi:MAG TPA: glycosyltransferase, partial [Herpetosiphonaceae bacterium]